eukprot:3624732-Pyramimonas_sp.AAC.1
MAKEAWSTHSFQRFAVASLRLRWRSAWNATGSATPALRLSGERGPRPRSNISATAGGASRHAWPAARRAA